MAADSHSDPLAVDHLIEHVKDATYFHVPRAIKANEHIEIPQVNQSGEPIISFDDNFIEPFDLIITKFMVLQVVAAVIIILLFCGLASRIKGGKLPKGRIWNMLEVMLLFIRDQVARPAIGKEDADRFMPFLWTIFFFVLGGNLLGMIPWLGSPTGALGTTGMLAFITFVVVVGGGMKKLGNVGFWKAQVPHMDLPGPMAMLIKPMVFAIEVLGLLIKHFVLSVRLLANMAAGHLVLAVLIAFIAAIAQTDMVTSYFSPAFIGVSGASIFGATALSLLELFVAFLQAYIFTFLSALFIGMAVHPH